MESLIKYSKIRIKSVSNKYKRYLFDKISWDDRLIGITGARGSGKTTILLQYLNENYLNSEKAIFVSMDDFYFTKNRLFDFAEEFYQNGGRVLFIDEIHKYQNWSIEIKSLYDVFSNLKIVFSGSSIIQIHKVVADLSRRAAIYKLHELSFRQYLNLKHDLSLPSYDLSDILNKQNDVLSEVQKVDNIIAEFKEYLEYGVYPYFLEAKGQFYDRLVSTINVVVENDLQSIENLNYQTTIKLRKILNLIADSVPYKVNISDLSRKSGLARDVLLRLIDSLERARLLSALRKSSKPTGHLTKPEKLYLNNTTLLKAISTNKDFLLGTVRETFFTNQLSLNHALTYPDKGDFLVDEKYLFEIGGKNKSTAQLKGMKNAFVAADDIEYGFKNKIPLFLFGFLY